MIFQFQDLMFHSLFQWLIFIDSYNIDHLFELKEFRTPAKNKIDEIYKNDNIFLIHLLTTIKL